MKTKEEIIKQRYPFYDPNIAQKDIEINAEAVTYLMDEYASQFQQEWIPVEKRLPEEDEDYLVTDENAIIVAQFVKSGNRWDFFGLDFWRSNDVTHWMPLPPQPQPYNPTKS